MSNQRIKTKAEIEAMLAGGPTDYEKGYAKAIEDCARVADEHALRWQALAIDDLDKANDANADIEHVWRRDAHQHKCMGSVAIDVATAIRSFAAKHARAEPATCATCGGTRMVHAMVSIDAPREWEPCPACRGPGGGA